MTVVDTRDIDPDHPDRLASIDDVEVDTADPDVVEYGGELVVPAASTPDPWAPVPGRNALERFASRPLPTLLTARMSLGWWSYHLSRAAVNLLVHSPQLLLYQVPHIFRGLGSWSATYAAWRAQPVWMAAAVIAEPKDRATHIARVRRRQIAHTRMTWVSILLGIAVVFYTLHRGWGWWLLAPFALLLIRADLVGRKGAPVTAPNVEVMPRSAFREGAPSHMVVQDVHAVLTDMGYDPERTAVVEPKVGEYGLSMVIHTPQEITEPVVEAIERGLQTFRGAVSIVGDPDNAALHELRVYWKDPLAFSVTPTRFAPNSMSIGQPAPMGYGVGNVMLELSFMRTNIIIVGGPGSGKSSTLWTAIDYLSVCRDVTLLGIDLSGGPALRVWGDVFERRAHTVEEAKDLLRGEIARCIERTNVLAERSEPKPGMPAPGSENWTPEDAAAGRGLFRIIIIDELPLLAGDKELIGLLAEHQRIGRKAGMTSVSATQDLGGDTLGATSLRKYPTTTILHACSREDVTTALGKGAVALGWAPHRLTAAEGDAVNDAGKAFVKSGRYNRPVPWRVARLDDPAEIWSRALERIDAGRPVDGEAPPVDATVIPSILVAITAVFSAAGNPEFMPTEELVAALAQVGYDGLDATKLAEKVKGYRVDPGDPDQRLGPQRQRWGGKPSRGYRRADVEAAKDAI